MSSKVNETLILTIDALRKLSPAGNNLAWMDNNSRNFNCHHTNEISFDIVPVSDDSRDSSDNECATTCDSDSEYDTNDDCDDSDIIPTLSQ